MIVVRSPLSLNFWTEELNGEQRSVVTAVDKFVYVVANRTPLIDKVSAKYSITESATHPAELQHTRIKAALLELGIYKGIEIGSFATLPARIGLGSSQSFTVALAKVLHAFLGMKINHSAMADFSVKIETGLPGNAVDHHSVYTSVLGGFNIIRVNSKGVISVNPVMLNYKSRRDLEDHVLIFYTDTDRSRESSAIKQRGLTKTIKNAKFSGIDGLMTKLTKSDFRGIGELLTKKFMEEAANPMAAKLYEAGMEAGAWGGNTLKSRGECLLFVIPPEKKQKLKKGLAKIAKKLKIDELKVIPLRFVQSGAEILFNGDHFHRNFI